MNDTSCAIDRATQAQIDRLVAGELSEGERSGLLIWLDEDVRRWRACAVAFLEAQSWEAAADWPSSSVDLPPPLIRSVSKGVPASISLTNSRQDRSGLHALAIAASIAIAFTTGILAAPFLPHSKPALLPQFVERPHSTDDQKSAIDTDRPLVATIAVRTNLDPNVSAQLQLPVRTVARSAAPASSISDYDRQQWERQGFELTEERRYLPARLPDGREVFVPINKVNVKLKGTPVS
jgi:hypothetical protein